MLIVQIALFLAKFERANFQVNPKTKNFLIVALCSAIILPFLWVSVYIHPSADDFAYAWSSRDVGFWQSFVRDYFNWNGRYFSNLLVFLNPIAFNSFALYKCIPIVLLITTVFAIYFLLQQFFGNLLKRARILQFSLLLCLLYLIEMPQLAQGIYWYTGAVTYQGAIIFTLLYLSLQLRLLNGVIFISPIVHHTLLASLIFCICGFNETAMLQLFLFQLFVLYKVQSKQHLIYLLLILLCSSLVIFSPGNAVRAAQFNQGGQFFHSISFTFLQTIRFSLTWIASYPLFLVSLLFLRLARQWLNLKVAILPNWDIKPIEVLCLMLLMIFVSVFPSYWKMGILGQHRTINAAGFWFVLIWFMLLHAWLKNNMQSKIVLALERFVSQLGKWIYVLLFFSLFLKGNLLLVCKDIFSGRAKKFDVEMNLRYNSIKACADSNNTTCMVDSIQHQPASIFSFDISDNENYWINRGEAAFFRIKGIVLTRNNVKSKQP